MLNVFNKTKAKAGLVGIYTTPESLTLAHVVTRDGSPELVHCEEVSASGSKERAKELETLVKKLGLEGARASFVLSPNDYKLLLVEAPSVEADEMAGAIKWKIKDLVGHPIEEMSITVFDVPEDAYRSQADMVYAVAARKAKILDIIDLVNSSGLELDVIDIPELVMMNITRACTNDQEGLAFLDLRDDGSTLNLSRAGEIYLTRRLNTRLDNQIIQSPEWETIRERLVLEIQRSLDYYQSQMGQSLIPKVVIAPMQADSNKLVNELKEAMAVDVESMDIGQNLHSKMDISPEIQQSCMLAIGGAMRQEQSS